MVRVLVCAAALLSCSAVRAERIIVTSASATYFTATDQLEIVVTFDRPLNLNEDYFGFWGGSPVGQWPPNEGFSIRNDDSRNARDETMEAKHIIYQPVHRSEDMGTVEYTLADRTLSFLVDRRDLGIGFTRFDFSADTRGPGNSGANSLQGKSAIDHRIVYAPEPSALALLALGCAGLLVHRLRSFRSTIPAVATPRSPPAS